MGWILYTSTPINRREAKTWDNCETMNVAKRGMNVRDQWWWFFQTKQAAEAARKTVRAANKNVGMKLTLRKVDQIPSGWE